MVSILTESFFKPTPLYKEFMILDSIEKNTNITQREMSSIIDASVSMVNYYLDEYETKGYIVRNYQSTKSVEYFITKIGLERKKYLNIGYLKSSQNLYNSAKENIVKFLNQIKEKGFKNILLYGAGEVTELLLHTINTSKNIDVYAIAIIDDDLKKIGTFIFNTKVISKDYINKIEHDGILISSYTNKDIMKNNLKEIGYSNNKIIEFFD
jgi:FlaA1/EpsC-like NDP-sugar epimerase